MLNHHYLCTLFSHKLEIQTRQTHTETIMRQVKGTMIYYGTRVLNSLIEWNLFSESLRLHSY